MSTDVPLSDVLDDAAYNGDADRHLGGLVSLGTAGI